MLNTEIYYGKKPKRSKDYEVFYSCAKICKNLIKKSKKVFKKSLKTFTKLKKHLQASCEKTYQSHSLDIRRTARFRIGITCRSILICAAISGIIFGGYKILRYIAERDIKNENISVIVSE